MIIDNKKYKFVENFEQFLLGQGHDFTYSICNDKLFFPKFKTEKTAQVIYYSKNCAVSKNGTEKEDLTDPDDCSLIPMPFAQQLLTYGACLRLKANPSYIRFSYWMSRYNEAHVNLKSKTCIDSHYSPARNLAQAINVNHGKKNRKSFSFPPVKIYTSRNINSMIIIQFFA